MNDFANVRKMYRSSLRHYSMGIQKPWTKDELLAGFQHFYELYGTYPKANQIDAFEYLPSSRSIQRSHGGLAKLRRELLPANVVVDHTKGFTRSATAKRAFANGRAYERGFYEYLTKNFIEIAVHEHKMLRPGNVSCDFFVYLDESSGVAIDIFYADSIINLVNVVNIKIKRYCLVLPTAYLVCVGNDAITQELIDAKVLNRKIPLPDNVILTSESHFKEDILSVLRQSSKYRRSMSS